MISSYKHFVKAPAHHSWNRLFTQLRINASRVLMALLISGLGTLAVMTVADAARLFAPVIGATLTDAFIGGDGDGKADPGETIEYTVVVPNTGSTDATGVAYSDTIDPNTTLVGGSVSVSPVTLNDTYTATGNISISVPAGSGVLVNDYFGENPAATMTASDTASANGGTVAVNADGSFTYTPPGNFTGTDTFTYTLANSTGSSVGTVTLTVSDRILFVSASGSGTNCRPATPCTLATADGVALISSGKDLVYVQSGTYNSAAITLTNAQKMAGQAISIGQALSDAGITLAPNSQALSFAASTAPVLNNTANIVTLNANVLVESLSINPSSGSGIVGNGITTGTATLRDLTIGATSSANGVNLTSNSGATFNFTNIGISAASGTAFSATGGGTINAIQNNTSTINTLTTTNGKALNVVNTSIGASGLTFRSISSNGAANGIVLETTGASGGLMVEGTGANGTGGTINASTGDGVRLISTTGATLKYMNITNSGNSGVRGEFSTNVSLQNLNVTGNSNASSNCTEAAQATCEAGIYFVNMLGSSNAISSTTVSGSFEDNIHIQNFDSNVLGGLTISGVGSGSASDCRVTNNNTSTGNVGIHVMASETADMTVTITNCLLQGNRTDSINTDAADSSTLHTTITGNTIIQGTGGNNQGNIGIDVTSSASATLRFRVDGNSIGTDDNFASKKPLLNTGINIFDGTAATSTMTGVVVNNKVQNDDVTIPPGTSNGFGIRVFNSNRAAMQVLIDGNKVRGINTDYGILAESSGATSAPGGGLGLAAFGVTSNDVIVNSGALDDIRLQARNFNSICGRVTGNDTAVGGAGFVGIFTRQANSATFNLEGGTGNLAANNPLAGSTGFAGTITTVGANSCSTIPSLGFVAMSPNDIQTIAQAQPEANPLVLAQAESVSSMNALGVTSNSVKIIKPVSWAKPQNSLVSLSTAWGGHAPHLFAVRPAPAQSGETIGPITIGTLPAGKSVTIKFRVTVDNPIDNPVGASKILNQGTVSGSNFSNVLTIDGGPADCAGAGTETCTPIDRPDTTVVSLDRHTPATTPTNAASVVWRVTFADPVAGLTSSNFSLANTGLTAPSITTVSAVSGAPDTQWDVTVNTGSGDGTLGLNMTSDTGLSHDVTNLTFTGQTYTIDKTAPLVSSIVRQSPASNSTNADVLVFRVTFNELVTSVGASSFVVTGTTTPISSSVAAVTPNLVFDFTIDGLTDGGDLSTLDGTVGLDIASSPIITDLAGNTIQVVEPTPAATNDQTYTLDNTAPTVTNVTSTAANGSYTTGAVIPVTVTFSEAVTVTGTPQLTLETGATDEVVNYTSGSGTATLTFDYTVQAGDTSADLDYTGTTSLTLNSGTIKDAVTNNATLTLATPGAAGSLGANKNIVIDATAPTVTNVTSTSANGSYKAGAVIPVTITFSEAVTVTGTPQLALETGATDQVVNYTSGSGTATLTFDYTVAAGDTSADLDYTSVAALALNGGTIKDAVTNNATLTLAAPGAAGSLGDNKNLVIDTTSPIVTNVTSTSANGTYGTGAVIPVTVTFSEAVTVTGTPQLTLETGATDAVVDYTSGSGSNTLTFTYTTQLGDVSPDLDYKATNSLVLNGGTIKDAATNNATLTLATPGNTGSLGFNKNIVIDATNPVVTNVTSTNANGTYSTGAVIPVTITFSSAVDVTGTPQLTLETGATDAVVDYASGSGTATLTFNYTVQAEDTSTDLDYLSTTALALNGGTIQDGSLNNAILTLAAPGAAGSLGANKNIVIDTTAPTVTNVTSTSANGTYTTGAVIPVTVTFSEAVTVTGTPQLTLETGATDEVVDYTSGSGTATLTFNYTVQAGDTSADLDYVGTTSLALNGGTIKDAVTNNAGLTLSTPGAAGSLGANKNIVIDAVAPTVTNVTSTSANGTYGTGAVIPVTVTFSEAVTVTGTPQLTLETGAIDAVVDYTSGSGTATLTFDYTVQAGDTSADLDYTSVAALALNGGTIKDAATNNATLTLVTPGAAGSLGANKNIVIDAISPTVTNVTSTSANGIYGTGAVIPVTVTFSEAVTVTGTPQLTLETGTTDAVVNYTSGSGTATLTFDYTVQTGDTSADLDYVGTTSLALNGGTIKDAATNNASLTLSTPGTAGSLGANKNIVIDTTAPVVNTFKVTTHTIKFNIPILAFTASDTVGVTGYLITESATPPAPGAVGWSGAAPTTYPVAGLGTYTLYPWAKDAVGNVSAVFGSPRTVEVSLRPLSTADFDGDGLTDISIFRPGDGWYVQDQFTTSWGISGDIPVPGDYDGDGKMDVAIYRPSTGQWRVKDQFTTIWGVSGDIPVQGDYDGNGTTELAFYRPSTGQWQVKDQFNAFWGVSGDIPIPGDYDGDGKADLAVYRPSTGQWFVKDQFTATWGITDDMPMPGDYNDDGKTDVAIYRPSLGQWYVKDQFATTWGISGDIPVPGDYNGDGTTDIAMYRPSTGQWFVKDLFATSWGTSGDFPLPAPDTNGDGDPYQ